MNKQKLLETFPFLSESSGSLIEEILLNSRHMKLPEKMLVKLEGDQCNDFVLMLSGEKRVYKTSPSGREITLYEIGPGDICVLNASSILSRTPLPANASTISETEVLLIPAEKFLELNAKYEELRTFVHAKINRGMVSVMTLISEIVFARMDERLRNYLVEKSEGGVLRKTHQCIANDLGTSREVVSRLLRNFEENGFVALSRNSVAVNATSLLQPQ